MIGTARTSPLSTPTRPQLLWQVGAFVLTLAGLVLALVWAPRPPQTHQALLAGLALALGVVALLPAARRSSLPGLVTGTAFATACWLAAEKTWEWTALTGYVPLLAPLVVGSALLVALAGALVRAFGREDWPLGSAALVSAGGIILLGGFFFWLITCVRPFSTLYGVERYQVEELIASALLYSLALWQGLQATRGRLAGLAGVLALVLLGFIVYWQRG
jgi:hypothetical protein